MLFVVVELTATDQVGEALLTLEASATFVLLCHCTALPSVLPVKVRVVLLVNIVEIPDKLGAVPTAQTATFPPVIIPATDTVIFIALDAIELQRLFKAIARNQVV